MRHVGLTSMTALALTMLISTLVTPVALADSTPPTIVVNGKIAECRYPTTTVELDPTVSDNADPLPQYWFDTPNDTDPDEYPIGTHLVTVYARDNQNNESSQTTTVLVQDTLAPTVMFDSNPPGCIASATSVSCECTSPDGSVLNINQSQFLVTDLCSQNPVAVFSFPDDNLYPYGSTEVTAQVFDTYGNTDTEIVTVNVIDQTPPVLEAIPSSFTVPSASGECTTANSVDGTIVRLPRPSATDACSTANQIAYTWTSDHFNESIDPVQCLPNGTHTIIPTIYDNYGNQPPEGSLPTFNVTVTDPSNLNLTLSATGPSGFHQDAQSVTASIDGAPGGSATWTAIAGQVPDEGSNQTLAASDSVNFTFSYEEVYCPVYLSVIVGGDSGADTSVCFAIDRTSPNHNFAGVGTTRISDSNPNLTIDVEADNSSTWPIFYYGEKLTLEFDALDEDGQVSSGISSVAINVLNADTGATVGQVLNQTAECNEGELAGCPTTMRIEGCDADSELCINNRLAFGRIGRGNFKLQITVTDGAGNASSSAYPFTVGNLSDNLATQVNWINNVRETATLAARGLLDQAAGLLNSASYLFEYSPGHAFILCETALQRLNEADTAGASIGSMREVLAKGVISEVRRIWEVHNEAFEAGSLQDWSILSNYTPDPDGDPVFDFTTETYKTRAFLVGATPQNELYPDKDHMVQIADTLELSSVELSRADELEDLGDKLDFAVRAFDSLVMLFDDQTYADLFGRPVYQTSVETDDDDNAVPYKNERYFRGNPPAHFGDNTALSVSGQIDRFVQDAADGRFQGINLETVTKLVLVQQKIAAFTAAAQAIKSTDWSNPDEIAGLDNFNNQRLIEDIYLNAQAALELIADLRNSTVYTHYWQGGLGLTLGHIINFSMYEGATSLYEILGNPFNIIDPAARKMLGNGGNFWTEAGIDDIDPWVQTAECRYNRLMQALSDGRIGGLANAGQDVSQAVRAAVDLFRTSKCLIIEIYNQNYLSCDQNNNCVGRYISTDDYIDPASYDCTAEDLVQPVVANECYCFGGDVDASGGDFTCDGIDDDCDGQVDEDYVETQCGTGPCINTSACVNGTEVECIPLAPPVTVDTSCDGIDNDCDEVIDDDWQAATCGLGGCRNNNMCVDGLPTECVPLPADEEPFEVSCDEADNDCDISIDEGLDNDRDGYGCEPGATDCNRPSAEAAYWCRNDNGTDWDCNDMDATVGPGIDEVCDYKDNDCDGEIDEGVLNACGHCGANCRENVFGPVEEGGMPFNPNANNANSIIMDENGELQIISENVDVAFAWVAVYGAGVVSKVDTATGKEVGRYCTAMGSSAPSVDPAIPEPPYGRTRGIPNVCGACGGCNSGSRTAVDASGNVYIANRAFSYQGSITKIANIERDCVDINNDGIIQTSQDKNNNGIIDMNTSGAQQEFYGESDECVLWTRKPDTYENGSYESKGDGYYLPRALALDSDGDIWLGNWFDAGFFEVNSTTGRIKRFVSMGINPYGAVVDSRGILWAPHSCCGRGQIRALNTTDSTIDLGSFSLTAGQVSDTKTQSWGDRGNYGLSIDNKNRVWVASYGQNSWAAARYDPTDNTWAKAYTAGGTSAGMGRGVTADASGRVWVAQHGGWHHGRITGYDADTMDIVYDKYLGSSGNIPIGIGVGSGGKIWTANQNSQNLAAYDPVSGALGFYPNDASGGNNLRGSLYTYSDFTGNLRATFTDPQGDYVEIVDGCFGGPIDSWDALTWELTSQPAGTVAKFQVRVSSTSDNEDGWSQWYPGEDSFYESSPADLSGVPTDGMRFIQMRMVLVANDNNETPILRTFSIARTCNQG